ncbi:hypothetical protein M885DRAFT_569072 [Pelagophyceae sp. CCMP2097]|nr:hypothetical protein M885DRAFT_569072 [Pelagophyceae sp. CCMP2097]
MKNAARKIQPPAAPLPEVAPRGPADDAKAATLSPAVTYVRSRVDDAKAASLQPAAPLSAVAPRRPADDATAATPTSALTNGCGREDDATGASATPAAWNHSYDAAFLLVKNALKTGPTAAAQLPATETAEVVEEGDAARRFALAAQPVAEPGAAREPSTAEPWRVTRARPQKPRKGGCEGQRAAPPVVAAPAALQVAQADQPTRQSYAPGASPAASPAASPDRSYSWERPPSGPPQ